ncbi:DNA-directed RNA polymerase III subunit RPC3-like [Tubulanus polymorphus]|uniref:DNA-directed RNA polymerase III subunit RPC3-like n=1 Tax=Tubulanus polymorphus TaxID=672921 RepID=UPI003DA60A74
MSANQIKLAGEILREYYGEVTEKIGNFLLMKGHSPLKLISQETKTKLQQVKKSLCVLIQHNIVNFEANKRGYVDYSINLNTILMCMKFPSMIYCSKTLYGDAGELVIEELLQKGRMPTDDILVRAYERLQENSNNGDNKVSLGDVKDKFVSLVRTHFIQRCPYPTPDAETSTSASLVPSLDITNNELYLVPSIDLTAIQEKCNLNAGDVSEPPKKKIKTEDLVNNVLWQVNYDRFQQHFRDSAIVQAVSNRLDEKAGEVMRAMLRLNEVHSNCSEIVSVSPPLTLNEIVRTIPNEFGIWRTAVDQYLVQLSDDSCPFITKIGDSGGGTFSIDFRTCMTKICEAHIEAVVLERFGSKCLRIFRLLLIKKHLEQKQIEEFVMIPAKETKELLYSMFGEQIVDITEVPKTPDHAPSRTYYVFTVDLNKICRRVLQMCYKTLYNLIIRRNHETQDHRRLLEKQQRVEAIAASMEQSGVDEAQRAEIEEMITPAERQQLAKVKHMTQKLEQSELEIDNTLFMLELYLKYANVKKKVV